MSDAESQLDGFIAKFDPSNQSLIRELRAALRQRLPGAVEMVWDNYNFLVIGYSASERPSDGIVSLAAGPSGVALSFYRGADLDDPDGVLLGEGSQNRFVRLPDARVLSRPAVSGLIDQAVSRSRVPLPDDRDRPLIIRSVSAKQRPRRRG